MEIRFAIKNELDAQEIKSNIFLYAARGYTLNDCLKKTGIYHQFYNEMQDWEMESFKSAFNKGLTECLNDELENSNLSLMRS
jgi:TPP-dependent 2-oxoacid decarboxylase